MGDTEEVNMVHTLIDYLKQGLSPEWVVFLISMLPVLELRGGLIAASLLGLPWVKATVIAIIGNALPVPFIVYFVERILNILCERGPFKLLARKMVQKGRQGSQALTEKYPNSIWLGLMLFVGIPLPGTGAWTGALVAAFLRQKPRQSIFPIALGLVMATVIMLAITYLAPATFGLK